MKIRLLSLIILILASFFAWQPVFAQSFNPLGGACQSQNAAASPACHQNTQQNGSDTNPTLDIIKTATNIIALIAAIGAVIMIVISGFMFVTAGGASPGQRSGDPNKVKGARTTLTNALIGLIIIALAWTIVTFVANHLIKT
jgi:ABC-type Fe3+ transport system permease subunit